MTNLEIRVDEETADKAVFLLPRNGYNHDMGSTLKSEVGKTGEIIAANYLRKNGYEILEKNFENKKGYRVGEIDIVAREQKSGEIAFVEVKTRRRGGLGSANPELAITRAKYQKLVRIMDRYLRGRRMLDLPHRLDAIAVEVDMETRKARLRHMKYIYY